MAMLRRLVVTYVCTASWMPRVTEDAGTKDPICAMQTIRAVARTQLLFPDQLVSRVTPLNRRSQRTRHIGTGDDLGPAVPF